MLTSSTADDMLSQSRDKKKESTSRRNLRVRLALERVIGRSLESRYQSAAMQQGVEREADACGLYEALTGRVVNTVGFVAHDSLMTGCSPDGYVDDWQGLVECKSPTPAVHWEYLRTGRIPTDYLHQIWHQLFVTGAQWVDWLSYSCDFPERLQIKLVRVNRDDVDLKAYELLLRQFLREVDAEAEYIKALAEAVA